MALRFVLELSALTALGYWGFHTGKGLILKLTLGIGIPLLTAVIWGTFLSPKAAVPISGILQFVLEIIIFGLAVAALYLTRHFNLAWIFGVTVLINRLLVYFWKQ